MVYDFRKGFRKEKRVDKYLRSVVKMERVLITIYTTIPKGFLEKGFEAF
jgi:hypothetical protein